MKGYKNSEIIGRHFSVFYPEEDRLACRPERELEIAAKEGCIEDEGWRIRKDGSHFWANVVSTALRDKRGVLIGFGKVTRDFTERIRLIKCCETRWRSEGKRSVNYRSRKGHFVNCLSVCCNRKTRNAVALGGISTIALDNISLR